MRRLTLSLSVIALVAALLPVARMATAEAAGPAPSISAPAGKTAVRASDTISVSGDAGGLPDGDVSAQLIALRPDGSVMFSEMVTGVSVSGGQYQGQVTLGCGFGEPGFARCSEVNPDPTGLITGVALDIAGAARSNVIRVDYVDPEILRYELIDATHVRVVFSEPVRMPANELGQRVEKPSDWAVAGATPLSVSDSEDRACSFADAGITTGCTRVLTLRAVDSQTEDATPFSQYQPDVIGRLSPVYQDYANNSLAIVEAENSEAFDLIRPAAPSIQTIDGKAPVGGAFTSNNAAPEVRVTNLRAVPAESPDEIHSLELRLRRDGGTTVRKVSSTILPESNTAVMTLPTMKSDGGFTVTAVAIDAAGNRSDDESKAGPAERADGARPSARYRLDRQAPEVLAATLTNSLTVEVELTEAILPAGDAGEWFVGDIPVTASGSGTTRTLESEISLVNPGLLRWRPTTSEAGSTGRYGDAAGNGMPALTGLPLADLPPLSAPKVTAPTSNTFTRGDQVTMRGTANNRPNLIAELFNRGANTVVTSAAVTDGRWAITRQLAQDGRYQYEVRIRDTETGIHSPRVRVADIVRDTAAPEVSVTAPQSATLPIDEKEYGVGDAVTVEWTATDAAAGDSQLPDHGKHARVILVSEDGARRAVSGLLEHQPGQNQTFTYRLKDTDRGGQDLVNLHFEVLVDDLARNVGSAVSDSITLLSSRMGYQPVLTEITGGGTTAVIEARFPVALTGTMLGTDWTVDGNAVPAQLSGDGKVISLTVPLDADPNATRRVEFTPTLPAEQRLRAAGTDRQISTGVRQTRDRVKPALGEVAAVTSAKVVDRRTMAFTGVTDVTSRRNTVAAFTATTTGSRSGPAIAKALAKADGTWRINVPLSPNRRNRIVLQAVDPSGNRSQLEPNPHYRVVEDSIAPVIRMLSPRRAGLVGKTKTIRWSTVEANKGHVLLRFRPRGGQWHTIADRTADDGSYRWTLPKSLNRRTFELQARPFDRTGKRGGMTIQGLRGDFNRPVLYRAVAVGERKVRLFFNEPVAMTRAGFKVDGIAVERVAHNGSRQTLILRRTLTRTTPTVVYSGDNARDRVGNRLAHRKLAAERGFVFSVTKLDAQRRSSQVVRLEWRDDRNRPVHVRHYRIYRDGRRIGAVEYTRRSFKDTSASGSHRYVVRAIDKQGRASVVKAVRVSR